MEYGGQRRRSVLAMTDTPRALVFDFDPGPIPSRFEFV